MATTKIVVLDDDPTGSQTVHSCLLLTRWDTGTLTAALQDAAPLFFVLTNTRGMAANRAAAVTREICINLRLALAALKQAGTEINPILVSRSDSTLRGHYPVETDVIAEELGPFDAHFLVPAFFEGGRITRGGVHYLLVDGKPIPVHETEFAKDSVFGYSTSYLPDYVAEKTGGRIQADQVERFLLNDIQGNIPSRLRRLEGNTCCVVDGEKQSDLDRFATHIQTAATDGQRFLFRSAASLLTSLAKLPPPSITAEQMASCVRDGQAGAIIVGSHVKKTTAQLNMLLQQPGTVAIEVDVDRIARDRDKLLQETLVAVSTAHNEARTPVVFTSRTEKAFADQQARLAFGEQVSALLMDIVRNLPPTIGFLISKGGITSNDVLTNGLALSTSRVLGQILAGCSVIRCPQGHPRFPNLPVVIFPGNVGDDNALATVYQRLTIPAETITPRVSPWLYKNAKRH
ncbi:MAG: four-carbon acid sugar kinase family protein [Gammaproteobacteria bacterium]|nr:four-carbon acid sugar kinase family protein [Gammaproteobacteria bacterium]